jgi:D-glycero-D-manno-heptose 1,7-bisphosphate phosphatase
MKRPAVFIDRDGTINEQMGYINHVSRFHLLPGVADAIRMLNKNNFLAIILTNQSGVARGYFPIELLHEVHSLMIETLRRDGANIDAVFFCPHYPGGKVPEYSCECDCRKPRTGLIDRARDSFDIDMSRSYMVGDHTADLELAHRCDLEGIMVRSGYGMGEISYALQQMSIKPCYIAEDLLDAVKWIIGSGQRQGSG